MTTEKPKCAQCGDAIPQGHDSATFCCDYCALQWFDECEQDEEQDAREAAQTQMKRLVIVNVNGMALRYALKAAQARRAFNRVSPVGHNRRRDYDPRRANYWARVYEKAKARLIASVDVKEGNA